MIRRIGVAAIAALSILVYFLRLDPAAGLFIDDAWYIVLAKALWQGDGFHLISSATAPILPAVPPGFPLVLAPVFGISPDFPANVVWFKAIAILAMFGAGLALYVFLTRYRATPPLVAAVVTAIVVLMPPYVFLATSTVMAEPVFTCCQLGLVVLIERAVQAPPNRLMRDATSSGVVAAATLLIRTAGVAAVMAAAIYLLIRRGRRAALVFGAVIALCYAPWAIYAQVQPDDESAKLLHGGGIAHTYSQLLRMRHGGEADSGQTSVADVPGRIAANMLNIMGRDFGAFILPAAYRGAIESGQEVFGMSGATGERASSMGAGIGTVWLSLAISAFVVAGYVAAARQRITVVELLVPLTLAMIALVPNMTFRYALPLAPFVVFYFFCGLERARAMLMRDTAWQFAAAFRVAAACVLVLFTVEHAQYIWSARYGPPPVWLREHAEARAVTDWMQQHLAADGYVASNNPGLVYLATGRRGVSMGEARERWAEWQRNGIRYGVAIQSAPMPAIDHGYDVLYASADRRRWIISLRTGLTESDKEHRQNLSKY